MTTNSVLKQALTAYLEPLLKKHASDKVLVYEDLMASNKAADAVLKEHNAEENVVKQVAALHKSQMRAYQLAARHALASFANDALELPAIASGMQVEGYVKQCEKHALIHRPAWRVGNAATEIYLQHVRERANKVYTDMEHADEGEEEGQEEDGEEEEEDDVVIIDDCDVDDDDDDDAGNDQIHPDDADMQQVSKSYSATEDDTTATKNMDATPVPKKDTSLAAKKKALLAKKRANAAAAGASSAGAGNSTKVAPRKKAQGKPGSIKGNKGPGGRGGGRARRGGRGGGGGAK